jgi:hypothetical protein
MGASLVLELLGQGLTFASDFLTQPALPTPTPNHCSSERTQWPSEELFPVGWPSGNWDRAPVHSLVPAGTVG